MMGPNGTDVSTGVVDLGIAGLTIAVGRSANHYYQNTLEARDVTSRFLSAGLLSESQQCVYASGHESFAAIQPLLESRAVDAADALATARLVVVDPGDTCMDWASLLVNTEDADPDTCLRLVFDQSVNGWDGRKSKALLSEVHDLTDGHFVAMCQYDLGCVDGDAVVEALSLEAVAIVANVVFPARGPYPTPHIAYDNHSVS